MLIAGKVYFRAMDTTRNKEGHSTAIKESVYQTEIATSIVYIPKKALTKTNRIVRKIDKSKIIIIDFSTSFSITERTSGEKISKNKDLK